MVTPNENKAPVNASGVIVHCSHSAVIPIGDLREHPKNPNKHSDSQIELLSKIIKEQGWRNPIVVSTLSGYITKGHARLASAKRLGLDSVPIDYQGYKDEKAEMADMLADNRIAELSDLSLPDVKRIILELEKDGFDMDLTGYDADALETLKNAFIPDDSMTPSELEEAKVSGVDLTNGRFILVFRDDEEKQFWLDKVGFDGHKIIWTKDDFSE